MLNAKTLKKVKKHIRNVAFFLIMVLNVLIIRKEAWAQEIEISAGKTELHLNEKFTWTISFPKDQKREFKAFHQFFFPEIADFEKGRTLYIEEEDPRSYKIIQYYAPRKSGTFHIHPLKIRLRDKVISAPGSTVKVLGRTAANPDPLPEPSMDEELEFEEIKADALLDIRTTKNKVYTGEGVGLSVSFLIALQNKAEITFFDLTEQRKEIIRKLKSTGCLTEDFPMAERVQVDTITYRERKYTQWKIYEGVFFPIDSQDIRIPALSFSVLTYKIARNQQESVERKTETKTFTTGSLLIKVQPLPLRTSRQIPTGYFRLAERATPDKFQTGKSFKYTFTVQGEGNIAAIPDPVIIPNDYFDIYAPKVTYEIVRQQGRITGFKSFVYYVTPKEPGTFQLSDYVQWPYFNTVYRRMDTLSSALSLKVRGESLKNNYISANNPGDFYHKIHTDNNDLRMLTKDDPLKFWANVVILIMLVITAALVLKK
jgi:hypothetical protein